MSELVVSEFERVREDSSRDKKQASVSTGSGDQVREGVEMLARTSEEIKVKSGNGDQLEGVKAVVNDSKKEQPKAPTFAIPKSRSTAMPPPDFKRPPAPKLNGNVSVAKAEKTDKQKDEAFARSLAVSAAAKAASKVAPGQMHRAISQAAAAVASAYSMSKNEAKHRVEAQSKSETGGSASDTEKGIPGYEEPSWGAVPERAEFFLEVMKGGQIIEKVNLKGKSHVKVGRIPICDIILQHPSASRIHGVLQFQGDQGPPKLYDMGSHGTFVNKKQIPSKTYTPLRVGDIMKFGQSSRMFILGGPEDMRPEEGLTRSQRHQLAALEAQERRKQREKEIAKAQMAAALNKGISWGMGGEDAFDPDDETSQAPTVDWRAYSSTHSLTEKQNKLADKIRRLENRIRNLTTESEKIRVKQSGMEELSAGQAQTLARNERVIDTSTDDLEDLEEQLNNSIAESLKGKKNKLETADVKGEKRKRIAAQPEEESESGEDDFYDRTSKKSKSLKTAKTDSQDPASIVGRKAALLGEAEKLKQAIEEETHSENLSEGSGTEANATDSLDVFMSDVVTTIENSKVEKLKKQLTDLQNEIQNLDMMLAQADPDGYFKEGTRASRMAKEKGIRLYNQDKDRTIALEAKKRQQEAAAKAEREAQAQQFVPEEEDDLPASDAIETNSPTSKPTTSQLPQQDSSFVHQNDAEMHEQANDRIDPSNGKSANVEEIASVENKGKDPSETAASNTGRNADVQTGKSLQGFGLQIMKKPERKPAAFAPSQPSSIQMSGAGAKLLESHDAGEEEGAPEVEDELNILKAPGSDAFVWKPPQNQTGDGRTSLNDKLGY